MEVFKGDKRKESKDTSSFDISVNDKHLLIGLEDNGFLAMGLYYDNPERRFDISESFLVDKSNYYLYSALDGMFFSYGGDVYFATEGAGVTLSRVKDGYRFDFDRTYEEKNGMVEASFIDDTMENRSLMGFFNRMQNYDPDCHQVHFSEVLLEKKLENK